MRCQDALRLAVRRRLCAKEEVLSYVSEHGPVDSGTVAIALGYQTRSGAGPTLLRLHRHRHLWRRRTESSVYLYALAARVSYGSRGEVSIAPSVPFRNSC
jgi:hypothetical protein